MIVNGGHWSSRFIGRKVTPQFDCATLAEVVQREVFGREVVLPGERYYPGKRGAERFEAMARQIAEHVDAFAEQVEEPREGDAVLLIARGRPQHIGIFCVVDFEPCVLHAADNAGQVVRHRIRELEIRGLKVEGYYRFL